MNHKADFPIFAQTVHDRPLVYLDSAASSQKPGAVIDAMNDYYCQHHANIHRGIHALSERATLQFEAARQGVQRFLNAAFPHEIIFTSGTTGAINLVAQSFGRTFIRAQDEIVVSAMEHHANIVPWQLLARETGAILRVIPLTDAGELDLLALETLFTPRTRLLALTHVSNVLGTLNPVREVIRMAHAAGVPVLLDGAQAVSHLPVDVRALDCDFYAFSAHKLYGPTGIGILYGKTDHLEKMPPWQGGGGMIQRVSFEGTTYAGLPDRFEAGTPPIAEAIGLHAAIQYVESKGFPLLMAHEAALHQETRQALQAFPGLRLLSHAKEQTGVLSFVMEGAHAHDVATILDRAGVAVRAGHHCAMPLLERLQIPACVRVSFGIYNTSDDVSVLLNGLSDVMRIFA